MNNFEFIDLFAGIGGFRKALEKFDGKCVFSSEWNPDSQLTYERNFGDKPFGDITKISESSIPAHDILCAGFPCQAFSISGKQKGFEDSRGTLFYDIARIVKYHKPKVLFLENVKNILSHSKGETIKAIHKILDELGYDVHYKLLTANNFGVPQARERVYFICFRKDLSVKFEFPEGSGTPVYLIDFIEDSYRSSKQSKRKPEFNKGIVLKKLSEHRALKPIQIGKVHYGGQGDRIYSPYGHAITLSSHGGGNFSKTGGYYINGQVRRLTPRECARIMGFPETFKIHETENRAYEQFGNSVVIPVLEAIFKNVVEASVLNQLPEECIKGDKLPVSINS